MGGCSPARTISQPEAAEKARPGPSRRPRGRWREPTARFGTPEGGQPDARPPRRTGPRATRCAHDGAPTTERQGRAIEVSASRSASSAQSRPPEERTCRPSRASRDRGPRRPCHRSCREDRERTRQRSRGRGGPLARQGGAAGRHSRRGSARAIATRLGSPGLSSAECADGWSQSELGEHHGDRPSHLILERSPPTHRAARHRLVAEEVGGLVSGREQPEIDPVT